MDIQRGLSPVDGWLLPAPSSEGLPEKSGENSSNNRAFKCQCFSATAVFWYVVDFFSWPGRYQLPLLVASLAIGTASWCFVIVWSWHFVWVGFGLETAVFLTIDVNFSQLCLDIKASGSPILFLNVQALLTVPYRTTTHVDRVPVLFTSTVLVKSTSRILVRISLVDSPIRQLLC